ncbi:DUF1097 domain-containing protein [Mesorhizobium sp.]|uniref:DUF1097 domain-containing protein n=1 Tax=Mesorhizobium sp. TaxID=1871066 RepID=UPI00257EC1C3|nr:DUF1097 domain-containing protein [Mesorhizobium sp.]
MSSFQIAAVVAGLTAALIVGAFLTVGGVLIWAVFLGWASFAAMGVDNRSPGINVASNAFGSFVGWLLAVLALMNPVSALPSTMWITVLTFFSVVTYIYGSKIRWFASIPAAAIGFAGTFGYIVQTTGAFTLEALLSPSLQNTVLLVSLSMAVGTIFAVACTKVTGFLIGKLATEPRTT